MLIKNLDVATLENQKRKCPCKKEETFIVFKKDIEFKYEFPTGSLERENPKYTLRKWHLVWTYQEAENGNYQPVHELQKIITKPYEEQTKEIEEKYYIKKSSDFLE